MSLLHTSTNSHLHRPKPFQFSPQALDALLLAACLCVRGRLVVFALAACVSVPSYKGGGKKSSRGHCRVLFSAIRSTSTNKQTRKQELCAAGSHSSPARTNTFHTLLQGGCQLLPGNSQSMQKQNITCPPNKKSIDIFISSKLVSN